MTISKATHFATVGLGYVGLPLALLFTRRGYTVTGIDTNETRVQSIRAGRSYISDVRDDDIQAALVNDRLTAETEFDCAARADVIVLCVPTPLNHDDTPDLSFLSLALTRLLPYVHSGQLLIVESSTYPGTTEEVVVPLLENAGLRVGQDVFVAFSPERINPGHDIPLASIAKIIGGVTVECGRRAVEIYRTVFDQVVLVSNARTAEMIKVVENAYRYVNISFVNELSALCRAMNIDIWEVIEGAATKPFGFTPFYPGPGVGGHCIPVDPLYLKWKADQVGVSMKFIELAHRVNHDMAQTVATLTANALAPQHLAACTLFVIGVTYKKNVNDVRESPALRIIERLLKLGSTVLFHDPLVPEIEVNGQKLCSVDPTPEVIQAADAVLILTDHDGVDYPQIVRAAQLILDTRNVTRGLRPAANIVAL